MTFRYDCANATSIAADACCISAVISECHIAYNTVSHVYYFYILGGVKFTYVVSTTRCIYTCPVSSGTRPRPPPSDLYYKTHEVTRCKYTSFPVIQTCNTFQKKLGQEQFRASNEVNWLNNDVIWNSWCQQVIVIMIWYKSSIQERSSPLGAKMGRGSPVCQQIREKIIEMFKNNVPQRKIGRDLDISPSTVHNIIKRFKESGGISVRKGQGRKPKLNNRDLRSLRRHCIKNRHSSISDITTWAQDYFGKPLSSTTIRSYIHKCQLKLYCAKRKPYVNSVQKRRRLLWARRHLGWTITQWKRVLWSDESVFQVFFGRNGRRVLRTKEEKDHPDCYQQQVQKPGSVMVWGCVSALGKGNLHFCDGTINAEKYMNAEK